MFIAVFALPWWVTAIFLLLAAFYWPWYYEAVAITLAYELVYRSGETTFWLTIISIVLIFIIEEAKERLYVFR